MSFLSSISRIFLCQDVVCTPDHYCCLAFKEVGPEVLKMEQEEWLSEMASSKDKLVYLAKLKKDDGKAAVTKKQRAAFTHLERAERVHNCCLNAGICCTPVLTVTSLSSGVAFIATLSSGTAAIIPGAVSFVSTTILSCWGFVSTGTNPHFVSEAKERQHTASKEIKKMYLQVSEELIAMTEIDLHEAKSLAEQLALDMLSSKLLDVCGDREEAANTIAYLAAAKSYVLEGYEAAYKLAPPKLRMELVNRQQAILYNKKEL